MNKLLTLSSLTLAALLTVPAAQADTMDKAQYKAAQDSIATTYKTDKAACKSLAGNANDVCTQEAEGKQKIAKAELQYRQSGKAADQAKIATVKADAAHDIAKEKCDDLAGNPKDVCLKEAHAAHIKATADAKVGSVSASARTDASKDKMDADYKVAAEKCDALAGDAKTACMTAAKARYSKS